MLTNILLLNINGIKLITAFIISGKDTAPHRASIASCVNGEVKRSKTNVYAKKSRKGAGIVDTTCRICAKEFPSEREVLIHFQSHRKNPGKLFVAYHYNLHYNYFFAIHVRIAWVFL